MYIHITCVYDLCMYPFASLAPELQALLEEPSGDVPERPDREARRVASLRGHGISGPEPWENVGKP
jgi:hypothetical protein